MVLSPKELEVLYSKAELFSTSKLHALDEYWCINNSHPNYQQIHEVIEEILIKRGQKTLKQEKLNFINNLENSFLISNPMGRLSANIIGLITKIVSQKYY